MRMTDITGSLELSDDEYVSIWSAMMETPRGRRFLSEFARRTRSAETRTLLDSVQTLEKALIAERDRGARPDRKGEPMGPDPQVTLIATEAAGILANVVRIGDNATNDILGASEALLETADLLRDGGVRTDICDHVEQQVADIRDIVAVQRITAERTAKVATALERMVGRLEPAVAEMRAVRPASSSDAVLPRIDRRGIVPREDGEVERLQKALRS